MAILVSSTLICKDEETGNVVSSPHGPMDHNNSCMWRMVIDPSDGQTGTLGAYVRDLWRKVTGTTDDYYTTDIPAIRTLDERRAALDAALASISSLLSEEKIAENQANYTNGW
jgi:hypothetical protein